MCLNLLNKEAKRLDTNNLIIDIDFKTKLQQYLEDISAHEDNRINGGFVNKEVIKAEFQADYIIAYRVISGATDFIFINRLRLCCSMSQSIIPCKKHET